MTEAASRDLWAFFGRISACTASGEPVMGTYAVEHQRMLLELVSSDWGRRELGEYEISFEPHLSSRALGTMTCRKRRRRG